jgi:hypothetical protein
MKPKKKDSVGASVLLEIFTHLKTVVPEDYYLSASTIVRSLVEERTGILMPTLWSSPSVKLERCYSGGPV